MLNKEKFAKEIVEIAVNGNRVAVVDGELVACDNIECKECDFYARGCRNGLPEWANSEYVENPKLTRRARGFCEALGTGWILRDNSGDLFWSSKKPKLTLNPLNMPEIYISSMSPFYEDLNFIENKALWAVEDLLKLEVENEI